MCLSNATSLWNLCAGKAEFTGQSIRSERCLESPWFNAKLLIIDCQESISSCILRYNALENSPPKNIRALIGLISCFYTRWKHRTRMSCWRTQWCIFFVAELSKRKRKHVLCVSIKSSYKSTGILSSLSINLLAFYHECRSRIGYATQYLFCDR